MEMTGNIPLRRLVNGPATTDGASDEHAQSHNTQPRKFEVGNFGPSSPGSSLLDGGL